VEELMGHADISMTTEFFGTASEDHEAKAQAIVHGIRFGGTRHERDGEVKSTPKTQLLPSVGR
jgi:hypothetical protein